LILPLSKKKILISPDSFKECANSVTIAKLIEKELKTYENCDLILKPISDGGDGFLQVCHFYFGGQFRYYKISTPYDESTFDCPVLYCESKKEMYIESAEVLGLIKVPVKYRKPLQLSSKGLGELLIKIQNDIKEHKISVNKVKIGIGGTSTIDMGIGMMSNLGLSLFNSSGQNLSVLPINFVDAASIYFDVFEFSFNIQLVLDVNVPLLGNQNGVRTFGKQKGANEKDIFLLEQGFDHLVKLLENNNLYNSSKSFSGAGGGIPFAFENFYNSDILSSQDFIRKILRINENSTPVDTLITGEGAYDSQSKLGKGAGLLINMFSSQSEKVFLICGKADKAIKEILPPNVHVIELNKYFSSDSESIRNYELGIQKACEEIKNR
jgi:glycerate kinase